MTLDYIREVYPDIIMLKGFDEAIIGISDSGDRDTVLAYDFEKIIFILMSRDSMTRSDALDFFDYNIHGLYPGTYSPTFITRIKND